MEENLISLESFMKYTTDENLPQISTPDSTPRAHPVGAQNPQLSTLQSEAFDMFFRHITKMIGRKPFYLGLRVSKSLVDQWCAGEKRDVFTAAKRACQIVREERRADLIPAILAYIAGADDCLVLTAEQAEALRIARKSRFQKNVTHRRRTLPQSLSPPKAKG